MMNEKTMKENGLYDIYDYWHVPFWQTQSFYLFIALAALAVVLLLLFFLIKKYYKKKPLSPERVALEQLAFLQKKNIRTRQDAHELYSALTDTMKQFFESSYARPFNAMTDHEMSAALETTTFPNHFITPFNDLINAGTSVKFAQEHALKDQANRHIQLCIAIIQHITQIKKEI